VSSDPATPAPRELGGTQLLDALASLARSPRAASALEGLVAFCALLVLRHADELEAEDEAVAVFDGSHFRRSMPVGVRWRDLCRMAPHDLTTALRTLDASLADCEDRGGGALARRVSLALPSTHIDDRNAAFTVVRDLSLSSLFDRHAVLDALDAVLFAAQSQLGPRLWTPPALARWMVSLAAPSVFARVYDPCFGVGTLLTEVVRQRALARLEHHGLAEAAQEPTVFGVELSPTSFAVGLARVILAGEDRPALEPGDALSRELPASVRRGGFDVVLMDSPFGQRVTSDATSRAELRTTSGEALFLQHAMACLRPDGRVVAITPPGLMFRGGGVAEVRRALLSRFRVNALIELPRGTFLPDTTVGGVIVDFSRADPLDTVSVLTPQFESGRTTGLLDALDEHGGALPMHARELVIRDVLNTPDASLAGADARARDGRGGWKGPRTFIEALHGLAEGVIVLKRLGDLASVSVRRARPERDLAPERSTPLVSVSDLRDGVIVTPRGRVTALPPSPMFSLIPGDVVVGVRGQRICAAVAANGAIGAVPDQSLFLLRLTPEARTDLAPSFLAALLEEPLVRETLLAGASSLRLSAAALSGLPIPVPPLPTQELSLRDREEGSLFDRLRTALSLSDDPLISWVESSEAVVALGRDLFRGEASEHVARLVSLAEDLRTTFGTSLPTTDPPWSFAEHLNRITPYLADLERTRHGMERLAVLQVARFEHERLTGTVLKGRRSDRGSDLLINLGQTMDVAAEQIARDHRIELARHNVLTGEGDASECALTFLNSGTIGVCALTLRGPGFTYGGSSLGPGEEVTFTARITHPRDAAEVEFVVGVSCRQFDGEVYTGRLIVKLDLQLSSLSPDRPLDASPYITGASLTRSEMVYGRDPIFEDLSRLLASPNAAPLVLLEGNKRVGKTSIMNQLLASRAPAGYVVSYATLQGAAGRSEGGGLTDREIWHHVAYSIADAIVAAGLLVPPPEVTLDEKPSAFARKLALRRALSSFITADHPYDAFVTWIELVLEALGERRLLVMIDEFDKLQEGVEAGVTSPQLVENLRAMYLQRPRLGFVIAGGRRLARLRTEYFSALFGVGHRITVGPLPEDAARALVTEPVRGQLLWLPDARDEGRASMRATPLLDPGGVQPGLSAGGPRERASHRRRLRREGARRGRRRDGPLPDPMEAGWDAAAAAPPRALCDGRGERRRARHRCAGGAAHEPRRLGAGGGDRRRPRGARRAGAHRPGDQRGLSAIPAPVADLRSLGAAPCRPGALAREASLQTDLEET
jgi:type I restriction enzyme M protein